MMFKKINPSCEQFCPAILFVESLDLPHGDIERLKRVAGILLRGGCSDPEKQELGINVCANPDNEAPHHYVTNSLETIASCGFGVELPGGVVKQTQTSSL